MALLTPSPNQALDGARAGSLGVWASPAQKKGHGGAEAVSWAGFGRMRG